LDAMRGDWTAACHYVRSNLPAPYVEQLEQLIQGSGSGQNGADWYRWRRILEVARTAQEMEEQQSASGTEGNKKHDAVVVYSGERHGGLRTNDEYDVRCFFLCPDERLQHGKVVDRRCEEMIQKGLLLETTNLVLAGQIPDMVARAIGYRQSLDYLYRTHARDDDAAQFHDFIAQFTAATRQYAKKQMQWFRRDAEFVFVPVPLAVKDASERASVVAEQIQRLLDLPRDEYELERQSPTSISATTRAKNAAQAKGMRVYQLQLQILTPGSPALLDAIAQADLCRHRLQAKKPRRDET
jgi:tRNA dimethylallyltransferase